MPTDLFTATPSGIEDYAKQLKQQGLDASPRDVEAYRDLLKSMSLSESADAFSPEQVYGASGVFSQPLAGGGIANLAKGGRAGFSSGTGGYDKPSHRQYLKQMDADLLKHFKRYKKIYGGKMNMKQFAPKFIKEYADGGIAGLSGGKKSGPPPISGPTPHGDEGLPAAFKNVRKR